MGAFWWGRGGMEDFPSTQNHDWWQATVRAVGVPSNWVELDQFNLAYYSIDWSARGEWIYYVSAICSKEITYSVISIAATKIIYIYIIYFYVYVYCCWFKEQNQGALKSNLGASIYILVASSPVPFSIYTAPPLQLNVSSPSNGEWRDGQLNPCGLLHALFIFQWEKQARQHGLLIMEQDRRPCSQGNRLK